MTPPPQRAPRAQGSTRGTRPWRTPSRAPRWHPSTLAALVVSALVLIVVASAALSGPWSVTAPDPVPVTVHPADEATENPPDIQTPEPFAEDEADDRHLSTIIVSIVSLVLLAALVLGARQAVTRRLRPWLAARGLPEPEPGDPATTVLAVAPVTELEEAAETAAHRLRSSTEPTDDVVAAWVALETAAGANGTERTAAQTPTEFTTEVLGTTAADPTAVRTLLRLYHRARFTEHPITHAQAHEAAEALEQLVHDLRSPNGHPRGDR